MHSIHASKCNGKPIAISVGHLTPTALVVSQLARDGEMRRRAENRAKDAEKQEQAAAAAQEKQAQKARKHAERVEMENRLAEKAE